MLGCGRCYAVDGNWKLTFPHCMFPVKSSIHIPGLNFADICPNQPVGNQAFCEEHLALAIEAGYPMKVPEFIRFCGANSNVNQ